jgi:hypothetical protein
MTESTCLATRSVYMAFYSLPAPQRIIFAKEEPHDDHHHYRF